MNNKIPAFAEMTWQAGYVAGFRAAIAIDSVRPASDGLGKAARDVLAERRRNNEIDSAAFERGRLAGLKEARSRASDYDQGPGDDTPMGPLVVAQVQTAQNIINALSRRIAEIEGASK